MAIPMASAFGKPPECGASLVKETVLRLANEHAPLPEPFSYAMDSIKATATKDNTVSCAADLVRVYREGAVYRVTPIAYSVARNPDGKLYIGVDNLPH